MPLGWVEEHAPQSGRRHRTSCNAGDLASLEGYRSTGVPTSILDAIKLGLWDFEPPKVDDESFNPTRALPGSDEKLAILADRLRLGLPLWHPSDSRCFADLTGDED